MKKTAIILSVLIITSCLTNYDPGFNYLELLINSPSFDYSSREPDAEFIYQAAGSEELKYLAEKWEIKKIAQTGTDFERMLKLMKWVNSSTYQDGSKPVPSPKTADNFLGLSAGENPPGLNCLATAITLTEVLLASDIPARTLTLLPLKASPDCHVAVMAWSREYEKWIFLDPSYNAWFPGPDGIPLSPMEIRRAFQTNSIGLPSEGSGWNGGPFDLDYLHYLSKNFFQFYSEIESSVGYEDSGSKRVRVYLSPAGINPTATLFAKKIIIRNPDIFFKPPLE